MTVERWMEEAIEREGRFNSTLSKISGFGKGKLLSGCGCY